MFHKVTQTQRARIHMNNRAVLTLKTTQQMGMLPPQRKPRSTSLNRGLATLLLLRSLTTKTHDVRVMEAFRPRMEAQDLDHLTLANGLVRIRTKTTVFIISIPGLTRRSRKRSLKCPKKRRHVRRRSRPCGLLIA
jgi:hypothetical protein